MTPLTEYWNKSWLLKFVKNSVIQPRLSCLIELLSWFHKATIRHIYAHTLIGISSINQWNFCDLKKILSFSLYINEILIKTQFISGLLHQLICYKFNNKFNVWNKVFKVEKYSVKKLLGNESVHFEIDKCQKVILLHFDR